MLPEHAPQGQAGRKGNVPLSAAIRLLVVVQLLGESLVLYGVNVFSFILTAET